MALSPPFLFVAGINFLEFDHFFFCSFGCNAKIYKNIRSNCKEYENFISNVQWSDCKLVPKRITSISSHIQHPVFEQTSRRWLHVKFTSQDLKLYSIELLTTFKPSKNFNESISIYLRQPNKENFQGWLMSWIFQNSSVEIQFFNPCVMSATDRDAYLINIRQISTSLTSKTFVRIARTGK